LPPIIRDNRFFMRPFFQYAYRGRNISTAMNFKRLVEGWSEDEFTTYYKQLNTISRNRATDLNAGCIKAIMRSLDPSAQNLIDVGCGNGYLLDQFRGSGLTLHGCDIVDKTASKSFQFTPARIEQLPFPDRSFDIVTCCHTLEHIVDLEQAISELKRIAAKQLIVVVPCQRWYFYTLDEHVNFFSYSEKLTSAMGLGDYVCKKIWGDWLYLGRIDSRT
jgi:ubiquinone/menaquinone biosynthesis C-methylase UbiE